LRELNDRHSLPWGSANKKHPAVIQAQAGIHGLALRLGQYFISMQLPYYLLCSRSGGMHQQSEFLIDIAELAFHVFALQLHHFHRIAHLLQQF
jgi:hypothetical protein